MKILTITILYNPQEKDIENINSFSEYVDEIILIDNSNNSNMELIKNTLSTNVYKKITYVALYKNAGIAAALNKGIHKAIDKQYDYVIVLDQDSKFKNNIIHEYKYYIDNNDMTKVAILAPQHLYPRRKKNFKDNRSVRWSETSGCLINLSIYNQIGGFDEKILLDGLDRDYCLKAISQGFQIIEIATAYLIHEPGMEKTRKFLGKKISYGMHEPYRYYYQIWTYWKAFRDYKDFESIKWIIIKCGKAILLFDRKSQYIKMAIMGLIDAQKNICKQINYFKI